MELEYESIRRIVKNTLLKICMAQKGDHFLIKPKQIAIRARLSTKPLVLTLVRHALEEIRQEGLSLPSGERVNIDIWSNSSHGIKYIITFPERIKNKELPKEVVGVVV